MDTLTLVRVNGAVQIGGGFFLAVGKFPRLAALALIGSIVPTTYAGHRFWEESDDAKRAEQRTQLFKNLGLLGGLIFAAVDTEGAPSLSWRTRRRFSRLTRSSTGSGGDTHHIAARAVEVKHRARRRAGKALIGATDRASSAATGTTRTASGLVTNAAKTGAAVVSVASPYVHQLNEGAHDTAESALDVAGPYVTAGLERAGDVLEEAIEFAGPYVSAGLERAGDILSRAPERVSDD